MTPEHIAETVADITAQLADFDAKPVRALTEAEESALVHGERPL